MGMDIDEIDLPAVLEDLARSAEEFYPTKK
jgi:hypothetical protein